MKTLLFLSVTLIISGCSIRVREGGRYEPVYSAEEAPRERPDRRDVIAVKEIKADRVFAREIHVKELHADRARIGRIVRREPRGKWGKGEIKQGEVSAEVIRAKEIHADYVEADVVYAHEVHIGN